MVSTALHHLCSCVLGLGGYLLHTWVVHQVTNTQAGVCNNIDRVLVTEASQMCLRIAWMHLNLRVNMGSASMQSAVYAARLHAPPTLLCCNA